MIHPNANANVYNNEDAVKTFFFFINLPIRISMTLSQISVVKPTLPIVWLRSEVEYNTAMRHALQWPTNLYEKRTMDLPLECIHSNIENHCTLFLRFHCKTEYNIIWFCRVCVVFFCVCVLLLSSLGYLFCSSFVCYSFSFKNWHDLCGCVLWAR